MKNEKQKIVLQVILIIAFIGVGAFILGWLIEKITGFPMSSHESYFIGLGIIYSIGALITLLALAYKRIRRR